MFQSFEVPSRPDQGPPRLKRLRLQIAQEGLSGFLVPRADVHQGEYVAPGDERLSWLTGFTGSAGFCAVLADIAGVFIDGRYRTQIKTQVELAHFTPVHWPEIQLGDWLKQQLPDGGKVGYDAWLHTADEIDAIEKRLADSGVTLLPGDNLIDRIWDNRPPPPKGKIFPYPIENAGETHFSKRRRLAKDLTKSGQKAAIITLPDSLCWLLNIRGNDVARNPVAHGFAILRDDARLLLCVDPDKLDGLDGHLGDDISVFPADKFGRVLSALTGPVRVDKSTAPLEVTRILTDAGIDIVYDTDPCILPKATKNPTEIAGTTEAHLRDGAAMVEFLAWLDGAADKGGLSEIDVVRKLEGFRRATNALREISFETICGTGPNGAIIHYRVSEESNRALAPGDLLLVDSGGQYLDGTTDITRTIAIGTPADEQKSCYTRVLQGMIAMSRARWPNGLAGRYLDVLARYPLWLAGQDYDHGTGHGVGVYLSVHEGPQRLSRLSDVKLVPGMILSNEPGYYREGAFGIRLENLLVVENAPELAGADLRDMLSFQTLTYVPLDRRLLQHHLMSSAERDWLNAYHSETRQKLAPRVSDAARHWLQIATAEI